MRRTESDGVVTLTMNHGKANAMDIELCQWLIDELSSAEKSARAVILTGTGSIFCAGVDLRKVVEGGADYVAQFFPLLVKTLESVFSFPRPLVAAINGHAIAGGCLLAAAADYRVMSGGTIGIPELRVGVPFPAIAVEILRFATGVEAHRHALLGDVVPAERARDLRLTDEVAAPEMLLDRALGQAKVMAAMAPEAFRLTKVNLRLPYLRDAAAAAELDAESLRVWSQPETHRAISAYLDRVLHTSRSS